ncbi:MAG: hypothetical protein LBE27_07380 [Deltaproteobacteria bacterium]|nr:hypothetical protein [Deltaproteobacteria bacterium]
MATSKEDTLAGYLHCPGCGKMVKLPADTCPFCKANMRTGERPEEKVPISKRKGFKTLVAILILLIPVALYFTTAQDPMGDISEIWYKIIFRLEGCAEPTPKMWEADNLAKDKEEVKSGYEKWKEAKKERARGQEQFPPDLTSTPEQKAEKTDRRAYFANTLISETPAPTISKENNWYSTLGGEWDIVWITGKGTPQENILTGEWNFAWVSGGEAMEDIMNVPYLWEMKNVLNPLRIASMRTFNPAQGYWEGAKVYAGRIIPFRAGRNQDGSIYETFVNSQGAIEFWVFVNMTKESFQVYISETRDNGVTYSPVAEIWAKSRIIVPQ